MHACMHACIHSCPFMHVHSYITMRTVRIYCLIFNYLFWPVWLSCSLQSPSWFVDDAFERWCTPSWYFGMTLFFECFNGKWDFCSLIPTSPPLVGFFDRSFFCGTQFCLPGGHRQPVPEWYGSFPGYSQTQTPFAKNHRWFPDSGFLLSFFSAERQGSDLVNLRLFSNVVSHFRGRLWIFFRKKSSPLIHHPLYFRQKSTTSAD